MKLAKLANIVALGFLVTTVAVATSCASKPSQSGKKKDPTPAETDDPNDNQTNDVTNPVVSNPVTNPVVNETVEPAAGSALTSTTYVAEVDGTRLPGGVLKISPTGRAVLKVVALLDGRDVRLLSLAVPSQPTPLALSLVPSAEIVVPNQAASLTETVTVRYRDVTYCNNRKEIAKTTQDCNNAAVAAPDDGTMTLTIDRSLVAQSTGAISVSDTMTIIGTIGGMLIGAGINAAIGYPPVNYPNNIYPTGRDTTNYPDDDYDDEGDYDDEEY